MSIITYKNFYITSETPVGAGGLMIYDNIIIAADAIYSLTANLSAGVDALSGAIDTQTVEISGLNSTTTSLQEQIYEINPIITGMILDYAGSSAPAGYLICDGSLISTATYADLYALIGS